MQKMRASGSVLRTASATPGHQKYVGLISPAALAPPLLSKRLAYSPHVFTGSKRTVMLAATASRPARYAKKFVSFLWAHMHLRMLL